jgi:hypothetical protein
MPSQVQGSDGYLFGPPQGHLQLAYVLEASGKQQMDLPTLPKYTHPNGCPFLCWLCILSRCRYPECHFLREGGHPDPTDITDNFANSAVEVLLKRIIARVNQLQGGGSSQIKKQNSDAGTPAWQKPKYSRDMGVWGIKSARRYQEPIYENRSQGTKELKQKL